MGEMTSIELAKKIRYKTLQLVYEAKASHIGGALSMTDILAVLYNDILVYDQSDPTFESRDRFLLSKGHACTSFYATLAYCGFFSFNELNSYAQNGSQFLSHASHKIPGVELSTGSLGHALPVGCGMALAAKLKNEKHRIFVLLSDGELDEGSNWESFLFAPQHQLDNLIVVVDYNKIQSFGFTNEVINLEPLSEKFQAFNWNTIIIDGHDHQQIKQALQRSKNRNTRPTIIIANTIKGKGIDFMENKLLWHYKSPNNEEYEKGINQLSNKI